MTDPGHPQRFELVVLPDPGEGDPVVDLTDLLEGSTRVLGEDEHPVGVLDRDDRPPPGDALAGVLRPVLHQLLGRHVERCCHERSSSITVRDTSPTTSSGNSFTPSAVTTAMEG